jgi:glycosyltransferase involved in cell wall biosynthesis
MSSTDRLRIALVSPPMLPVPPPTYAGTERVVAALAEELHRRGHRVTLFAPGDSQVSCELVPILPHSLWSEDYRGDVSSFINVGLAKVWAEHERFDVIHSHVETLGFLFARFCPTPVLTTLHGRLDAWGIPELIGEFADIPLVAISESQRRWAEDANWVATIRHGLPLEAMPFSAKAGDYLAFVGRITPEKGVADCVELARRTKLPLKMAAKVYDEHERSISRRSSGRPSTRASSSSWASSASSSATRSSPAPWRPSCAGHGRSRSASWRSSRWLPAPRSSPAAPEP